MPMMASLAKKIKTKLSSTKHGRYTLDNTTSTPNVLLQNVSHHVDTNTQETLYSDSGGLILDEKRGGDGVNVTVNGFIPAQNESDDLGDKVMQNDEIDAADEVSAAASKETATEVEIESSGSGIAAIIPDSHVRDLDTVEISSSLTLNQDLKLGQAVGAEKSRENGTAKTELVSYENPDRSVRSTVWYIHADSDFVDTRKPSDLSTESLTAISAPIFQTKASAIWYDSETESRTAVRTSIDSGYEKSPDPTLEPSIQSALSLLPDVSATSTVCVSGDLKSKSCLASENLDSSSMQIHDRNENCGENSKSSKLNAEGNISWITSSPGEGDTVCASGTAKNDFDESDSNSAAVQNIGLPDSKNLPRLSCDHDSNCEMSSKPRLEMPTQISAKSRSKDFRTDPELRSKPLGSASIPGEDKTRTPVMENVLCSSVATGMSTTPGRKYSPAVDDWGNGRRQMQEMGGKNSMGNSSADNSLQNTRNVVVMVSSGIPQNFSPTAETANFSHSRRDGLGVDSATKGSSVMSEASSRRDHSCTGELSGGRQTDVANDSEVLLYITEDEDEVSPRKESVPLSRENPDEIASEMCKGGANTGNQAGEGVSKENPPVLSTDLEINEIVKNYDNIFFQKTGNKCITLIGDERLVSEKSENLKKETKILNLDNCEGSISENPSSFLSSRETVSSAGFVQSPDKELCGSSENSGQQSDDNNLDSFDELEGNLASRGDGNCSGSTEGLASSPNKLIGHSEVTPAVDSSLESDKLQNVLRIEGNRGFESQSRLDSSMESSGKLDSSMESQGDVPLIIFEMDEDKTAGVPKPRPVSPSKRKHGTCCCSCHAKVGPSPSGDGVVKKPVTRSSSDEPMQSFVGTRGLQYVGSACSSLSEPAELNNLGQEGCNSESVDPVSDLPKTAGCSKTGASLGDSLESKIWNDLSGNLGASTKPCSCPELSVNNLDSPPPTVERRQINDPLPPLPPFHALNIPQTAVSDPTKAPQGPKFEQFACGHKVPLPPAKPEQTGQFVTSSGVQNETYAMLKDVRVEKALTTPRVRNMRTKPVAPPSGRRGNSMYCDNRTYIDTCDINVGGSTACNCDSGRSKCAPSRKTLDDVPPPVPRRNYSLYSTRTRPRVQEDSSSSDSDSSSSANSLDALPNLNRKKHAIPNEYIDSDEFPRSPASNEDLRRWEDALSLPTEPDDPESATLFHIHNTICDMCRLRGQGKALNSPSKHTVASGLHPQSSGSRHPLCFNKDDVKFIRTSGQQLDPGTGRPINPQRTFYDSDSESDSGIGTEIPKSRSSSSGEMIKFDRYNQNLLRPNPNRIYARSQKAKSLPQNFANKTYISDAIFHEGTEKSGQKFKEVVIGIPGQKPPPVPKRNYSTKQHSMIQTVANNPPPPVPRKATTLSMKSRSFSDEDLVNEPIHMSLQEMGRDPPAVELRASEDRSNHPNQLLRPQSCSPTQNYMHHSLPPGMTFVDLPPPPKQKSDVGKVENTDSSDDSLKDKPPHVPPREKKKNPLSALFKPKQKLGNIFHWKSKDKTSQPKLPHRKLPPLPPPEQEVIFCPEGEEVTTPTDGACGGLKDMDKDGQNSSNFIESLIRLREVGWYWGPLNLEDAEAKLTNKKDGSFLVRDSSHDSYILSLSFRSQGKTHHTRIEHCHGTFGFWSQPVSHGRMSIIEFIERAMEFSRNGKFLYFLRPHAPGHPPSPVALLYPISRFEVMQSLQHTCRFVILKHVRYDHIEQLPLPGPMKRYLKEKQYFTEKLENESDED